MTVQWQVTSAGTECSGNNYRPVAGGNPRARLRLYIRGAGILVSAELIWGVRPGGKRE